MHVRDRHHVVEVDGGVRDPNAADARREQRVTGHHVQGLVDVGHASRAGDPAQAALRLLHAHDVGVGRPDRPADLVEVDLDAAVPDVERHHGQRLRPCRARECERRE